MELLGAWEHDRTHGQNLQADLHGRPWGFGAAAWSCKKHGVDLAHIVRQRAAARRHLGEIGALSPSKRLEVFEVVRQPFFLKLCSVNDTGHKRCRVACGAGSQFARRWGFRSAIRGLPHARKLVRPQDWARSRRSERYPTPRGGRGPCEQNQTTKRASCSTWANQGT
jgi:hypothetical protein